MHSDSYSTEPPEEPLTPPLEGVVEPSFPQVGLDLTPSPEQIARGAHGNGSWDLSSGSTQLAVAQFEVQQQKKADKDERREIFNERAKAGIVDSIDLLHRLVKRAALVMDKVEAEDPEDKVTSVDLVLLEKGRVAAKELMDRGVGKSAVPKTGPDEDQSIGLAFFLQGRPE